jgi:hypothetical protein
MRRSSIVAGIILILVGLFFLLLPLFPNISGVINIAEQWPLIIVAVGALFLFSALIGAPGLAIPGSIITGIGCLLLYQNLNDAWESWAYAWALIPGFVGIGIIIARALEGETRRGLRSGGTLIFISLVLFLAFGAFLGDGISFGVFWAVLLIGLGIRLLIKTLRGASTSRESSISEVIDDEQQNKSESG